MMFTKIYQDKVAHSSETAYIQGGPKNEATLHFLLVTNECIYQIL